MATHTVNKHFDYTLVEEIVALCSPVGEGIEVGPIELNLHYYQWTDLWADDEIKLRYVVPTEPSGALIGTLKMPMGDVDVYPLMTELPVIHLNDSTICGATATRWIKLPGEEHPNRLLHWIFSTVSHAFAQREQKSNFIILPNTGVPA